jgi:hypothetical protein
MNTKTDKKIPTEACACGCGRPVRAGTTFAQGHHMRAAEFRRAASERMRGKWGDNHPAWRGGRHQITSGHIQVTVAPDHPLVSMASSRAAGGGHRVLEHRLVVANDMKRPLTSEEQVHHIDKNKVNNSLNNLVLVKGAMAHARIHKLQDQLAAEWDILRKLLRLGRRRRYTGPVPTVGAGPLPPGVDLSGS